ncbi:SPFH domain-containing protein, partial [Streptococcus suis]
MFEEMTEKEQKTIKRVALVCGVVLAAVLFRVTAVTKIPANTVGVYYSATSGVQNKTLSSGYHIKVPFMDTIYKLPTSVQTSNI